MSTYLSPHAPYRVNKCKPRNTPLGKAKFYELVNTRTKMIVETDENRKYLESIRNRLNTDWFFDKYV